MAGRVNVGQVSSALEISMAWIYLAAPVGGLLMPEDEDIVKHVQFRMAPAV